MDNPLLFIPGRLLPRLFWPLFALTLILMAVMNVAGQPLITPAAPLGIISFEFAGKEERAHEILASWNNQGALPTAAFIQGLDFLFLIVYSTTLGLGCAWSARTLRARHPELAGLGNSLAWGQWTAAAFDALENVALIIILFGGVVFPWPQMAWICAAVKFAFIFLGLVYIFSGLILRLRDQPRDFHSSPPYTY